MEPRGPKATVVLLALLLAAVAGFGVGALTQSGSPQRPIAGPEQTRDPSGPQTSPPATTPAAGLTITAVPEEVGRFDAVTLSGELVPAEADVRLQVQRDLGDGWEDFPVTASTGPDGSYEVVVQSGRAGPNAFRVVRSDAPQTSSEPVTVTIG